MKAARRFWSRLLLCGLLLVPADLAAARASSHHASSHSPVRAATPHKHTGAQGPHTARKQRARAQVVRNHAVKHRSHAASRHYARARTEVAHKAPPYRARRATAAKQVDRRPLIVIDAGHGGRDPGAVGRHGTQEKAVSLTTALELKRLMLATGRYRVAMTRETDTYVPLDARLAFARRHAAALFVSIHADASSDRHARGASVYVRANQSTRSMVQALTSRTAADPQMAAGSVSLQRTMIENLDETVHMLDLPARTARLHVLAAAEIPSVLLELGFLSNRNDEALLRQSKHRAGIARSIRDAIDDYFHDIGHPGAGRT